MDPEALLIMGYFTARRPTETLRDRGMGRKRRLYKEQL